MTVLWFGNRVRKPGADCRPTEFILVMKGVARSAKINPSDAYPEKECPASILPRLTGDVHFSPSEAVPEVIDLTSTGLFSLQYFVLFLVARVDTSESKFRSSFFFN